MSYVLGYVVADGCISISKDRKKNRFSLNITSAERDQLERIQKALGSGHKISQKKSGGDHIGFQLLIRNPVLTHDLMSLGVQPRKTYNLGPIQIPDEYFADFARGFFDGDGTVYIYKVNEVPQIKAQFVCVSLSFISDLNRRLCKALNIPLKSIQSSNTQGRMAKFSISFYIHDCEKLKEFLYKPSTSLYLPRKRAVFEAWRSIARRPYIKRDYPSKIGWHLNRNLKT